MTRRERIEAAIESLITLLDDMDGDPDLEVDEDEPEQDSEPPLAVPYCSDLGRSL